MVIIILAEIRDLCAPGEGWLKKKFPEAIIFLDIFGLLLLNVGILNL